jgi:hypothetical protein
MASTEKFLFQVMKDFRLSTFPLHTNHEEPVSKGTCTIICLSALHQLFFGGGWANVFPQAALVFVAGSCMAGFGSDS